MKCRATGGNRQEDETGEKGLQNCGQTGPVVSCRDLGNKRVQEARQNVDEMMMLRWMCGVTDKEG